MTLDGACGALLPPWLCGQQQLLLYLAPSALLAVLIRALAARHPFFFLFTVAGTLSHELAHFGVGLLSGAGPGGLTIIPRRAGPGWELGSVRLTRLRWYNAAPVALAPFLVILLPWLVARWRTGPGWQFEALDALLAFAVAPQFLACWPSGADWKIALRSWPALPLAAALYWGWRHWLASALASTVAFL